MENRKYFFLYPFSILYKLITDIRNFLFDKGILLSMEFSIPVICIGNITVGGTGKTPHAEHIIRLLKKEFKVAILSRGYKRKSSGFRVVTRSSKVGETGDEPLQICRKFPDVLVTVDRNRVNGIKNIMKDHPETDVIILDDGFQHRSVRPGLSIMLTDYNRLITRDYLMPYGRLRENRKNRKRADILIISKTPEEITKSTIKDITSEVKSSPGQKIYFTKICYDALSPVFDSEESNNFSGKDYRNYGAVLITGIASPGMLSIHLKKQFKEIIHLDFPDHYYFDENDIQKVKEAFNNLKPKEKLIITTEKDAVRLRELSNIEDQLRSVFCYLPVRVSFVNDNETEFDNLIFEYVRKNKRNNRIPQG